MLNQDKRHLKLHIAGLPDSTLLPVEAKLSEAVSQSFIGIVHCVSSKPDLDLNKLIGQSATVSFHDQYFNGVIHCADATSAKSPGLFAYTLTVKPQFQFLDLIHPYQTFVDKSVIEIFQACCKTWGFHDYDLSKLTKSYSKLDYVSQFDETGFTFLSRLLAEAGIYYYYQHNKDSHTLCLLDAAIRFPKLSKSAHLWQKNMSSSTQDGVIHSWQEGQQLAPLHNQWGPLNNERPSQWDFPTQNNPKYHDVNVPETALTAQHYPVTTAQLQTREQEQRIQLNALGNPLHCGTGASTLSHFRAGHVFHLSASDDLSFSSDECLIQKITHTLKAHNYLSESQENAPSPNFYENHFEHTPAELDFAPANPYKKPEMPGLQTAHVFAPEGNQDAIYCDELGRVKVTFPWNRHNADCSYQTHSNWLRVKQSISGHQYGSQFLPRMGQEVVVSYEAGNGDLPLVLGTLVNASQAPAYNLSQQPNLTWLKSNFKDYDNPELGNALVFDDTPGNESLLLQAEKDYLEEVLNNATQVTEGNDTVQVDGDMLIQAFNGTLSLKGKTFTLRGGGSEIHMGEQSIQIKGKRINLYTKGAGDIKPIARVGDKHQCPKHSAGIAHHGGPILKGATSIVANGKAIARKGDKAHCRVGKDEIKEGIDSLVIDGKPAARLNHKFKHKGVITSASKNIYVGEKPSVENLKPQRHLSHTLPCEITTFSVRCDHDCRSFQLQPLTQKPNVNDERYVLEVIASDTQPDTLKAIFKGQCHHSPKLIEHCPEVELINNDSLKVFTDNQLIPVYGPANTSSSKDFTGFLKQIILPLSEPNQYHLIPRTCLESGPEVTVDVYPPVKWEGGVSIGYEYETEDAVKTIRDRYNAMVESKGHPESHLFQKNCNLQLAEKGSWDMDGDISVTRNGETWSLGHSAKKEGEDHSKHKASDVLFKGLKTVMDKILPVIGSMQTNLIGAEIEPPNLKLSGEMKNQEVPGKYDVGLAGEIKVAFDPLISIELNIKILNWLIAFAGPGLGTFLLKVKERAEKGIGNEEVSAEAAININFEVKGEIRGDVSWKKEIAEEWECEGQIEDSVDFRLVGDAHADVHVFIVKAAAGVKAYADSGLRLSFTPCIIKDKVSQHNTAGVEIQCTFDGLIVYYAYFVEFGIRKDKNNLRQATPLQGISELKKSYHHQFQILEKHDLFKHPIQIPLNLGGLE